MARGLKKGQTNNPNGRKRGVPNKTTKQARELLQKILYGEINKIPMALNALRESDPAKYLDACSKLFAYVLPKRTDLTSDDKPLQAITGIEYVMPHEDQDNANG